METINPFNGQVLSSYDYISNSEIEKAIQFSFECYKKAQNKSTSQKSQQLKSLASKLRENKSRLSLMMTREMGKVLADSETEIEKCAVTAEYFAENLEKFSQDETVKAQYPESRIVKNSMGPILAIMPWNFPLWQIIRVLVPAIGVGNPLLLKHADATTGTAKILHEICEQIEAGLLIHLIINHEQAAQVIAHPMIRAVTLTGSARAGREIAAVAGKNLKKTVLELGGSDAYIVLEDADIDKAAKICAAARMVNNGQSCVAGKRFIVQSAVLGSFLKKFSEEISKFKMGNPEDRTFKVGPLAAKKFQKGLLEQCEMLESLGAKKVFDADEKFNFKAADAFFPARIYLIDTKTEKERIEFHQEELFGPVAQVFSFLSDEEALEIANKSIYGLGGAVFSKDLTRAEKIARKMECGIVAINDQVKSDARLPFGGVKDSGYGRELSLYGFNEFSNIKSLGITPS